MNFFLHDMPLFNTATGAACVDRGQGYRLSLFVNDKTLIALTFTPLTNVFLLWPFRKYAYSAFRDLDGNPGLQCIPPA